MNYILTQAIVGLIFSSTVMAQLSEPIVNEETVFDGKKGVIVVEAEHFYKQTNNSIRQWYRTSKDEQPRAGHDEDGKHLLGSSNYAYLEILPDTRVTHADEFQSSVSFSNKPGEIGVLHYKVNIRKPGRYYVWVKAYSTGSEDNGIHVGLDGEWPESGQRMQWCEGKKSWKWESKQRTAEQHCGVPHQIYLDIEKEGIHEIMFSMREDGFEFDQFILARSESYVPSVMPPEVEVFKGEIPEPFPVASKNTMVKTPFLRAVQRKMKKGKLFWAINFPMNNTNFYKDKDWLAINPNKFKEATVTKDLEIESGKYDLIFMGVGENDGGAKYKVAVNGKDIGMYTCPMSENSFEEGLKYMKLWSDLDLTKGDKIAVTAYVASADGKEWSRARWSGFALVPAGEGGYFLYYMKELSSVENVPLPSNDH